MIDDFIIKHIKETLDYAGNTGWHPFYCDDVAALVDRLKAAEGECERLRQALESIRAYWNGDSNETTTLDAIRRAVETAAIALENTDAR